MSFVPPRFRVYVCAAVLLAGLPCRAQAADTSAPQKEDKASGVNEDELRRKLAGKTFYLRGGYLDNTLAFDEHGKLAGHAQTGSYTLCLIEIDKIHLTKHRVELTGVRYGLHFLGALPSESQASAQDRVRITPKKKLVRITIDREQVVTPKKKKDKKHDKAAPEAQPAAAETAQPEAAESAPADAAHVTTTTSPAHAREVLEGALRGIFTPTLDETLIASLPDFWKLYYQAAAAQKDYAPEDPAVLRQSQVDSKARLSAPVEPPSNEYAQAAGVAGMALYHTVVGPDGKPQQVVVGRPIGFGLDENAAEAILKANFEPARKDGHPVTVLVDVVVQFRIYSNRTRQTVRPATAEADPAKPLPGPYSLQP